MHRSRPCSRGWRHGRQDRWNVDCGPGNCDRQGQKTRQDGTSGLAVCSTRTPHPIHRTCVARQYRGGSRGFLHTAVRIALYRSRSRRSGLGCKSHRRTRRPSCNCASARSWTKGAQGNPLRASLDVAPLLQEGPAFRATALETARGSLLWASVLKLGRDARHVLPQAPDRLTNKRWRNKGTAMQQAQRSGDPTPSDLFAFSWPCAPRILPAGPSKE